MAQLKAEIAGLSVQRQAQALRPPGPVPPPSTGVSVAPVEGVQTSPNQLVQRDPDNGQPVQAQSESPECSEGCEAVCEFWNEHPELTEVGAPPSLVDIGGQAICCGTEPCGCVLERYIDGLRDRLKRAARRFMEGSDAGGDGVSDAIDVVLEHARASLQAHEDEHVEGLTPREGQQEGRTGGCAAATNEIDNPTLDREEACSHHVKIYLNDNTRSQALVIVFSERAEPLTADDPRRAVYEEAAMIAGELADDTVPLNEQDQCDAQWYGSTQTPPQIESPDDY